MVQKITADTIRGAEGLYTVHTTVYRQEARKLVVMLKEDRENVYACRTGQKGWRPESRDKFEDYFEYESIMMLVSVLRAEKALELVAEWDVGENVVAEEDYGDEKGQGKSDL